MLLSGLTSDTFPKLVPRRIVEVAQAAGIEGIEWEAVTHVPIGDLEAASRARAVTEEAGMVVISYGVDEPVCDNGEVERILATASELGAAAIRVRAGHVPLSDAETAERERVTNALSSCVQQAERQGILVAVGLHPMSLASSADEAMHLLKAAQVETAHVFWRPKKSGDVEESVSDLQKAEHAVLGVHCTGVDENSDSTMLSEVTDRWARYLDVLRAVDDDHWLCLRGVEDDRIDSFYRDAQTLRRLAARYGDDPSGEGPAPRS